MLKSLDVSLKVMKYFTHEKNTWGVRELSKACGVNHTTIYRILETMKQNDYVIQNPETKKYSLGIVFWELGTVMKSSMNVEEIIRPILTEMCEEMNESVFFTVLDNKECVTLVAVEPTNRVKFSAFEGSRAPLHAGASYRVILAYQKDQFINEILGQDFVRYTSETLVRKKDYLDSIQEIKKQGFAVSCGEYTPDVVAIAVPVQDASGRVTASLTISGPIYRFKGSEQKQAKKILLKKQQRIVDLIRKFDIYFT